MFLKPRPEEIPERKTDEIQKKVQRGDPNSINTPKAPCKQEKNNLGDSEGRKKRRGTKTRKNRQKKTGRVSTCSKRGETSRNSRRETQNRNPRARIQNKQSLCAKTADPVEKEGLTKASKKREKKAEVLRRTHIRKRPSSAGKKNRTLWETGGESGERKMEERNVTGRGAAWGAGKSKWNLKGGNMESEGTDRGQKRGVGPKMGKKRNAVYEYRPRSTRKMGAKLRQTKRRRRCRKKKRYHKTNHQATLLQKRIKWKDTLRRKRVGRGRCKNRWITTKKLIGMKRENHQKRQRIRRRQRAPPWE